MFADIAMTPRAQPLLRFVRSPKRWLIAVFTLLTALALMSAGAAAAERVAVAVAFAAGFDVALTAARGQRIVFPDGAILTGMIVALILRPTEPFAAILLAVMLALASKHFIRTRWSNVLNPAAAALVVTGIVVGTGQSWWGALPDWGFAGALIVLCLGVFISDRVNKLPMVLAFLGGYFGLCTIMALAGHPLDVAGIFRAPDLHAALFFALFMLNDPPTSPVRFEDQFVHGLLVATLAYFLLITVGVVYYLPLALLGGNVWESARRLLMDRQRTRVHELATWTRTRSDSW